MAESFGVQGRGRFYEEAGAIRDVMQNHMDPILGNATPVHAYEPHTWGPPEANQIIAADGGWHNPATEAA